MLGLNVIRLFVHSFIESPPPQLDPDVLSHSLNRLCKLGLELNTSALTSTVTLGVLGNYYEVIPTFAFPKCDDVVNGKLPSDGVSLFINFGYMPRSLQQ